MTMLPGRFWPRNIAGATSRGAFALAFLALALLACEHPHQRKPIEMAPIGTVPAIVRTVEEPDGGVTTTPNSGTPMPNSGLCVSADIESVEDMLRSCDVPMPRPSEVPTGLRDKLELRLTSNALSVAPGAHLEVTLTLRNRSNEPLPLYFTGDPTPRFEIEALDVKGRRVDLPAGKPPKQASAPSREVRAARITLAPGGVGRVKLGWDPVKTRWAPERLKTWEGRGFPRGPAGPLPLGKYVLRVVAPLVGVFEKGELEVPKLSVDVGTAGTSKGSPPEPM